MSEEVKGKELSQEELERTARGAEALFQKQLKQEEAKIKQELRGKKKNELLRICATLSTENVKLIMTLNALEKTLEDMLPKEEVKDETTKPE